MANNQISKAFQFEGQPEEQFRITLRLQNDEEVYSHPKSSEPRQGQCSRCHRTQCWHSKTGALLEPLMKKLRHDETECAICKDAINARQWLFHNPYCNHVLHFECYHMHCQNDRRAAHLCPTCRQPIRPWLITDYFDASLPEIVPSKALCQAAKASHAAVIKGDLFVSADAKLPFNVGHLSFTEDQVIQVKSTRRAKFQYAWPQTSEEGAELDRVTTYVRHHLQEFTRLPEISRVIGCWIELAATGERCCALVLSTWLASVDVKIFPAVIDGWPVHLDSRQPRMIMDVALDRPYEHPSPSPMFSPTSAIAVAGEPNGSCAFVARRQDKATFIAITAAHVLMTRDEKRAYDITATFPAPDAAPTDVDWVISTDRNAPRYPIGQRVFPAGACPVDVAYVEEIGQDSIVVDATTHTINIDNVVVILEEGAVQPDPNEQTDYEFCGLRSGRSQGRYVGADYNLLLTQYDAQGDILDPPTQPRWMFAGEDHFGEAGDLGSLVWRCNPDSTHTAIGILVQEIGNAGDRRGGLVVPWEQVLQALPDDIVL
eukprot:m.43866 g.43866  ORF g.43866 m.43866 type:complete len:543 (-) comp12968_c0_seq1:65-1693(-)